MNNTNHKKLLSIGSFAITGLACICSAVAIGSTLSHQPVRSSDTVPLVAVLSLAIVGGTSLMSAAAVAVDE